MSKLRRSVALQQRKFARHNHFAKVCFSKSTKISFNRTTRKSTKKQSKVNYPVDQRVSSEVSTDDEYIFSLKRTQHIHKATPQVQVTVNTTSLSMLVDTGASVDIVHELAFNTLRKYSCITLQPPTTRIFACGAKKQPPVKGQFSATIHCSSGSTTSQVYVV